MRNRYKQLLGILLAASMIFQTPAMTVAAETGEDTSVTETEGAEETVDEVPEEPQEEPEEESEESEESVSEKSSDEIAEEEETDGTAADETKGVPEDDQENDSADSGEFVEEATADETVDEEAAAMAAEILPIENYDGFLQGLQTLEGYAEEYAAENGGDSVELTLNYVRTGVDKYATGLWNELAGPENTAFTEYVAQKDAENGTGASAMKDLGTFTAPNGQDCELNHMFGVMDITYHNRNASNPVDSADLGGWAGDLVDLLYQVQQGGVSGDDLEAMVTEVRNNYLGRYISASSFGQEDIYADLDAYNIIYTVMNDGVGLSDSFRGYLTSGLSDPARAQSFVSRRFRNAQSKTRLRKDMLAAYSGNFGISMLESSRGLDEGYDLQRQASVYAFADYLADLIGLPDTADNDENEDDNPDHSVDMDVFMEQLRTLESYADAYTSGNSDYATWLVLNYAVLSNQYYSVEDKESLIGTLDTDFAAYVDSQNEVNGTSTSCFKGYGLALTLRSNEQFNLAEMMGAIGMVAKDSSRQDLAIWGMDIAELMAAASDVSGDSVEEKAKNIRKDYLGVEGETGFGILEIRAKLDAVGVGINLLQGMKLSEAIDAYYTEDTNIYSRAKTFIAARFPNIEDKASLRNAVVSVYNSCGASAYEQGGDEDLRTATCYAWADYLANLAFSANTDPEEQSDEEDLPSNDYYSVFSSTSSNLAPGVKQTIRYALTADDKQIVYYIATVDVGRDDIEMYANYNNNSGSSWGMQSVTDQTAAWQRNTPASATRTSSVS